MYELWLPSVFQSDRLHHPIFRMTCKITPNLLIPVFVLLGCDGGTTNDTSPISYLQSEATILSSYYGLDELPPPIVILCQGLGSVGEDGMPVTFSEQIDAESL